MRHETGVPHFERVVQLQLNLLRDCIEVDNKIKRAVKVKSACLLRPRIGLENSVPVKD